MMRPRRWATIVPCASHRAPTGKHCDPASKSDCLARKIEAQQEEKRRAAEKRAALLRRFHDGG